MAKDLSTIQSNPSEEGSIDINQITNSGSDTDRDQFNTPPTPVDTGNKESTDPSIDSAKDIDSSTDTDDDKGKGDSAELKTLLTSFNDEDLDEDTKVLKSELLEKYKGTAFNENGDIIDENDNITTSVEDVLKSLDEGNTTNDKGDLVDAEGNVVKTKTELAAENSVVNKLHSELDYEFLDDKGEVKIYTDDNEGMKSLSDDMANYKLEQFKSSFFNQNPELAEISKHILSGGSLDTFKDPIDYSKVSVKDLEKSQKLNYIKDSLKAGGMTDTRITAMIKRIEDSNDVDAEAEEALADLTFRDKESKKVRDATYKQSVDDRNTETAKYWDDVQQTINKGELNNVNVPEKDKEGFFDYISSPIDDKGNSKEMQDSSKESMEQKLAFAYIRFKGYKLDDIIDAKSKTKNVHSLMDRLKRSAKMKPTPANDANGITSRNTQDISINSMLD